MNDDSGHVQYRVEGNVAMVTFARPSKKNAFTHAMYTQFAAAMEEAGQDRAVRAILLSGAAGSFTSGNDLRDFMHNPPTSGASPVWTVIRALVYADKPVIAAVEGVAVGIGTTMLLHCDFVYAAEDTRFVLPFVSLGLTPEAGSSLLLPALAGLQKATDILMLEEKFDAVAADEMGLVTKIVPKGAALDVAKATARRLVEKPRNALAATKRLLREPVRSRLESVLQDEGATFVTCLGNPEAEEAFSAFFEKRKPDFSSF